MSHLVALYIMCGLIEAIVPRVTTDMKAWKTILICILACGAAYISMPNGTGGPESYWYDPWLSDLTAWGNFGSSWAAAIMRILFLLDVSTPRQSQQIWNQVNKYYASRGATANASASEVSILRLFAVANHSIRLTRDRSFHALSRRLLPYVVANDWSVRFSIRHILKLFAGLS